MAGKVFSDIYNESARDTGDTTTSHVTYVKKKVNDALRMICNEMDFSWLRREADVTLVASQQYLNMADIASDWDTDTPVEVYYRNSANQKEVLTPYDEAEWEEKEDLDEGDPFGYHITMKSGAWRILFTYVPNSNFISSYNPLKMNYRKVPTELSGDNDVPELPTSMHQGLVYYTNMLISAEMGDAQGISTWSSLARKVIGQLNARQVNRLGRPKRVYPRGCVNIKGRSALIRDYNK